MGNLVVDWTLRSDVVRNTSSSTPADNTDDAQDTYQQTGQFEANITPAWDQGCIIKGGASIGRGWDGSCARRGTTTAMAHMAASTKPYTFTDLAAVHVRTRWSKNFHSTYEVTALKQVLF